MCKAMEDLRNESEKGISVEEIAEIVGFSTDGVKKWIVTEV